MTSPKSQEIINSSEDSSDALSPSSPAAVQPTAEQPTLTEPPESTSQVPGAQNESPEKIPSKEEQISLIKQRRVAVIEAKNKVLERDIAAVRQQLADVRKDLREPDAAATVKTHIKLLHKYNEIRDIGQGLMGLIADQRNTTTREIHAEFGVGAKD